MDKDLQKKISDAAPKFTTKLTTGDTVNEPLGYVVQAVKYDVTSYTRHETRDIRTQVLSFTAQHKGVEVFAVHWLRTKAGYRQSALTYFFDSLLPAREAMGKLNGLLISDEQAPEKFEGEIEKPEWVDVHDLKSWLITSLNSW